MTRFKMDEWLVNDLETYFIWLIVFFIGGLCILKWVAINGSWRLNPNGWWHLGGCGRLAVSMQLTMVDGGNDGQLAHFGWWFAGDYRR